MKICFVHFGALMEGGYPPDTRALAGALSARGHDVTVVADPGPRREGGGTAGFVDRKSGEKRLAVADVVHMMGVLRPSQIRYVESLHHATPVVISPLTQLCDEHLERSRWKKRAYVAALRRHLARRPVSLHGFSNAELDESTRYISPQVAFVASSGVFPSADRYHWSGKEGHLLFFGRNDVHQKGLDLLLQGYRSAVERGLESGLVIAGQPWGKSTRWLKDHSAGMDVRVLGPVTEETKWDLLCGARSLVYLSRWDGPPRPIREAISVGAPSIVSHGTNMGPLVSSFQAGVAVVSSPGSIADALLGSQDPGVAARWSDGADRLRSRLAWSEVAADYEAGYRSVLETRDRGAA
jgi:glycosyltransferase involved in cell wall biosynthesis